MMVSRGKRLLENIRFSAGIWVFSPCADRFEPTGYKDVGSPVDRINMAGQVEGLEGLILQYPTIVNFENIDDVRNALKENKLKAAQVDAVLFSRKFAKGSFTSADEKLRSEAIKLAKETIDITRELGSNYAGFWLGQDGYDYPFQVDYRDIWDKEVSAIKEIAEYAQENAPNVKICLEYKLKEPRCYITLSSAAKVVILAQEIGMPNVGATLDFGHCLFGQENPAESVEFLNRYGRLFTVHINDNYSYWDDDLFFGSLHTIQAFEFVYSLSKVNYQGWIGLDLFPYRESAVSVCEMSIKNFKHMARLLDEIPMDELQLALSKHDAVSAFNAIKKALFKS